jgi:hypothetical protein
MAAIEFRNLRKSLGAIAFVCRADVSNYDCKLVARVGPSGRGRIRLNPAGRAVQSFDDATSERLTA